MFTRKHFRMVAENVRNQLEYADDVEAAENILRPFAESMADEFKRSNSRFDRAKFMDACGFDKPGAW